MCFLKFFRTPVNSCSVGGTYGRSEFSTRACSSNFRVRLLALLIIALSGVIVFSYFPGFGSPAFQGISIFLGVLFSLGSTAVVSNIVAGIILVYTRAFQIGDRVKIGEATGDIVNKTLLVTRIRTVKNVVITLPNSQVLGSQIVNYSAAQDDPNEPPCHPFFRTIVDKDSGHTSYIERFNNTMWQRVSRLVRKTLSLKLENHIAAIWYFIHHYNEQIRRKQEHQDSFSLSFL